MNQAEPARVITISLIAFALGSLVPFLIERSTPVLLVLLAFGFLSSVIAYKKSLLGAFFISFTCLAALVGVIRSEVAIDARVQSEASVVEQEFYMLEVVSDPVMNEFNQVFEARAGEGSRGKFLVRAPFEPRVSYGDMIATDGSLKEPEDFETESGRLFPYEKFLEKDYIFYTLYTYDFEIVAQGEGNKIIALLLSFKHSLTRALDRVVGKPASSLLAGVTLGAEEGLGEKVEEAFRRVGIIHIIVLSGYNVTIVAEGVARALSFLPRTVSLGAGIFGIVLFALMTGASATIIRASIMASIALIGRLTYREYSAGRALLVAGFLMILHNPYIILYDPSFQLSFLATLGIIFIAPYFEARLQRIKYEWLRLVIAATLGTQIAVLPLLVFMSGNISIVSLITNILIVPIVPTLMFLGGAAAVASFINNALALPFAFLGNLLSHYVFKVVDLFANIPFATINTPPATVVLLLALYAFVLVRFLKTKKTLGGERTH